MVDFHGFELPIWYSSIQEEHISTRSKAGMFDVSHMGFFRFHGLDIASWLSSVSTQNILKFDPGRCGYTHFLDNSGHIIDDMIFAVSSENEILGVPNSTMASRMLAWLSSLTPDDGSIEIEDLSDDTSIIALQGPLSEEVITAVLGPENVVGSFKCRKISDNSLGISGWIQGTGYTGERGVEIFVRNESAPVLWEAMLGEQSVTPVGLGARDTLRMEMGYLLSGQDFLWPEIDAETSLPENFLARTTLETCVPYGLDMSHDFLGKEPLVKSADSQYRWWGMVCLERGPSPRPGHQVFDGPGEDSSMIGYVTSGGPSPSLGMNGIAMGYLEACDRGMDVWIQTSPRRRIRSEVKRPPFIQRN